VRPPLPLSLLFLLRATSDESLPLAAVSAHCLDEKNDLWLERIEETKLAVLKELQAELSNRASPSLSLSQRPLNTYSSAH